MKIAIVGYGKMGKTIEEEAHTAGVKINQVITSLEQLKKADFAKDEVAIEFTHPEAFQENLAVLAEKKVNVVCGTTGWDAHLKEVRAIVSKYDIGFLSASNFSVGVHLFYRMVKEAAKLINKADYYDMMIYEAHHKNKKDAPSGTANSVAEILLEEIARKTKIVAGNLGRELKPEEIHISSARCGNVVGQHQVIFDSEYDTIEVSHSSKGRRAYAQGAIECAKWLAGKKGFYTIDDYLTNKK